MKYFSLSFDRNSWVFVLESLYKRGKFDIAHDVFCCFFSNALFVFIFGAAFVLCFRFMACELKSEHYSNKFSYEYWVQIKTYEKNALHCIQIEIEMRLN